jgi:hypothetical protein
MKHSAINTVSLVLALFSMRTFTDETYTQLGTWTCQVTGRATAFVCPVVTFPAPFESVTAIIVIGCSVEGICYGRNNIQYSNVTSSGFHPVLNMGGNSDWRGVEIKPRVVIGQWIAIGSRPSVGSLPRSARSVSAQDGRSER